MSETITYQADGLSMKGQLFLPSGTPKAGVLVFPEAFGISEHALGKARRLADAGYAALAADLHGDARLIDDLQEAIGALTPLFGDPSKTRARATGALNALHAQIPGVAGKIAAIGFCFGGTMALELARSGAHVDAVVGFHSGLGTAAPKSDANNIRSRVLVCIGADDPMIKPEERATFETEMRDAKVDYQLHLYGGVVHSFTNPDAAKRAMPDAIRYSASADHRSWASMHALFTETFG